MAGDEHGIIINYHLIIILKYHYIKKNPLTYLGMGLQVMSITETQYSGESVIIISPDSDNLSILQAALLGLDLRQHKEFAFQPGEVKYFPCLS